MAREKFKFFKRQSGKTTKLVNKYKKELIKGHPILITARLECSKHIDKEFGTYSVPYQKLDLQDAHEYSLILIDDFVYIKDLMKILNFAKKNNIKVICYSSQYGD